MYYYNRKYGRDGHLFKERFKSEPVNDMEYFTVLLRYIHQNPVKAGIVEKVKDYEFSSWGEYDGTVEPVFQICDVNTVLNRITFKELDEWVNDPLADDVCCLDNDNERPRLRLSDDQVWQEIIKYAGVGNSSDFQKLEKSKQRETLRTYLTNYSYLKLHNQEEICEKGLDGINFRNFAIHRIYDGDTACDVEVCLREIKNHNNNARLVHFPDKKDIDTIRKKYPTPDLLQFTCGHDIIHGVVRRLTYLKGSSPEIGDKEIARQLRTSFSIELFKKTRLYSEVLAWAVSKKTVVWAA